MQPVAIRGRARVMLAALWAGLGVGLGAGLLTGSGSLVAGGPPSQAAPELGMPLDCRLGETCFVQNFVDVDPGAEVRDFGCGGATYADHDGTDFRVLSARVADEGVAVKAAAAGTVKGVRDGMADQFATAASRSLIAGRECGNGLVLDHGGGWETQYCHLKSGSVTVKTGERVEKGQILGSAGYSGLAEFAHLHLTVRRDGQALDPFTGEARTAACLKDPTQAAGLWDEAFRTVFAYRSGELIAAGFAGAPPDHRAAERDDRVPAVTAESPAFVFYARFINLRPGDRVRLRVTGPGGFDVVNEDAPLDRFKATYLAFLGRRLKEPRWPAGAYVGTAEVWRDGAAVITREQGLTLP